MTDRRVLAAGVILTAVVAGIVTRAEAGGADPDPQRDIARALSRAITVDQALATSANDAGRTGSAAPRDTIRDRRATLLRYFTGRALRAELARLEPAAQPSHAADVVAFGGGVRVFSVTRSSRLDDNTAVLTGTGTAWARVGQVQADRTVTATPSNDIVVTATLDRDAAGVWRVAELSWSFAPGSVP
jgi:hypothetical protein